MGSGPPGRQYYWQLLLYAKMLKETENEETRLLCHIFIIDGISIGEGIRAPCPWLRL